MGQDKYVIITARKVKNISLSISLVMISEWIQKVGSSVPRGFSRYYVLDLLKAEPHTGKEIIDHAVQQSDGIWKPSPGLVYPLLGRLLDEGLVEEADGGRYQITKKGAETAGDLDKINETVRRQLDVLLRLGNVGRFVAMDLLERMSMMGAVLSSNMTSMTDEEKDRYRSFLKDELDKIEGADAEGKEIKIE